MKFGKAPEAYKEVKSEKREQFVEKELSMNAQSYYGETVTPKSTPNPCLVLSLSSACVGKLSF